MSKYTDDELYQTLTETGRLLRNVKPVEGEEFSLDAILAEYGREGPAKPAPEPAPTRPEPVPAAPPEAPAAPVQEPEPPAAEPPAPPREEVDPATLDTQRLRKTVAANMEKVMGPEKRPELKLPRPDDYEKLTERKKAPAPAPDPAVLEQDTPVYGASLKLPQQPPALQVIHGGLEEEQRQPARPPESIFPEEPEGMHKVPLEQVMSETVEAVLDEDDAILEQNAPLGDRIREALDDWQEKFSALLERRRAPSAPAGAREEPEEGERAYEEPEPDMDTAVRVEKRLCKRLYRHLLLTAAPALALVMLAVLDGAGALGGLWGSAPSLRSLVYGAGLLLAAALALPVWQEMWAGLRRMRPGCELAACLAAAVTLADCLSGAVGAGGPAPFAAPAAVMIWLCLLGLYLRAESRRAAFHLANIGGTPPYGVSLTAAGACKQKGTVHGFYNMAFRPGEDRNRQALLVPLGMAAATILAAVSALGRKGGAPFLWTWSALLMAGLPLAIPLTGALPLRELMRRLVKSGSAVAGVEGARSVSRSRRMVVTDDDLFPPGTVGLNGLKIYGEEIGKVVSYAASMTEACHSQLQPLFEQLLAAEGGLHMPVSDLHYYEEGGVGGTIRGETVTMGSAYFMRKTHVTLPQELKLKTGVFLAVDGVLIAIFAIKYQPSRNVEWALRAMRRNRIEPVLAVRSCNVTPGLLKRKFSVDTRAVYPDVSTRLALSDVSREAAAKSGALIYRDGLMPFAETAVGSRRMLRSSRWAAILACLGAVCGLLLTYYLTGAGAFTLLQPLRMLLFQGLWLLPTLLLSGLVRHY